MVDSMKRTDGLSTAVDVFLQPHRDSRLNVAGMLFVPERGRNACPVRHAEHSREYSLISPSGSARLGFSHRVWAKQRSAPRQNLTPHVLGMLD